MDLIYIECDESKLTCMQSKCLIMVTDGKKIEMINRNYKQSNVLSKVGSEKKN